MSKSTAALSERRRKIVHRTRGLRRGAITRLMSPGDLGHILKPFVSSICSIPRNHRYPPWGYTHTRASPH